MIQFRKEWGLVRFCSECHKCLTSTRAFTFVATLCSASTYSRSAILQAIATLLGDLASPRSSLTYPRVYIRKFDNGERGRLERDFCHVA